MNFTGLLARLHAEQLKKQAEECKRLNKMERVKREWGLMQGAVKEPKQPEATK